MSDTKDQVKCKNKLCENIFDRVKKGGHIKLFCSSRCRSQYHSNYGVLEGDKLIKFTAMTRVIFPTDLLKELNYRVGRINAGLSNGADLSMITTIIDYMNIKVKEQSSNG